MTRILTRRRGFILISGICLVICVVVLNHVMRDGGEGRTDPAGTFLLNILTLLNLLVLMALVFVLFRQLVKGYLEWRRQREGARFRTRLLTAFVLLGLFPSLLLFVGAIQMIESTVDRWFRSPVHEVNTAGQRLVDKSLGMVREETYRKAEALVVRLEGVPAELRQAFAEKIFEEGALDRLWVVSPDGSVLLSLPEGTPDLDPYQMRKIFNPGGLKGWMDLDADPMVVSGLAVDGTMAVAVASFLPSELFAEARFIAEQNREYLRIRHHRTRLKVTMISSFLALTLLVTFAAVWIGSHLSREISVPLQLLLEGTREVSRGNLDHAIPYEAKDEIGIVVASFNQMTRDLAESKVDLERSNLELVQTSQAAERRRRYIETLLETLSIGVVSTGREGDVRMLNRKARQILGMATGETARNALSRPAWSTIREAAQDLGARPLLNREVVIGRERGHWIVSVSAAKLKDPEGEEFGTLYILEDITDLSKAQRIAAWQEVARRMAHEIKNPLTPIRLSAQRIRKKFREGADDLSEAVSQGTTTIEREVEGMLTMVNEFSRFARLPEVRSRSGSLPALIRETIDTFRVPYPKVTFDLDLPENFPSVQMDLEQMNRVFKNLVENSIEAMKMSGRIAVSLKTQDELAICIIQDTGPGIPPEAGDRLFLPYYSTKRRGTGLGLAIVARIIEEHGGHIQVDESYREGAGFILTFPIG